MVEKSERSSIINELHRVASELGVYCLGTKDFEQKDTKISYHRVTYIFDSWADALNAAGLGRNRGATKTQCVREVTKAVNISGNHELTKKKYKQLKKKHNLGASPESIRNHFGSFTSMVDEIQKKHNGEKPLLEKSKYTGGDPTKRWDKKEIEESLNSLYEEMDEPLKFKHIRKSDDTPSQHTLKQKFGGWREACEESEVPISPGKRKSSVTKEECKKALREVSEQLGGEYVGRDKYSKHRKEKHPTTGEIRGHFYPWRKAAYEAGITDEKPDTKITTSVCIDSLYKAAHRLGRSPSTDEYDEMDDLVPASSTDFKPITGKRFDDLKEEENLETFSGLDSYGSFGYSDEELVSEIKRIHEKLDKQPSMEDIQKHSKFSVNAFNPNFDKLLKEAGFDGLREVNSYNESDCVKALEEVNQKVPANMDYSDYKEHRTESHPSLNTIRRKFDSFENAKKSAAIEIEEKSKDEYEKLRGIWDRKRKEAIKRDNGKCQRCGRTREEQKSESTWGLTGHHIIKHNTIVKYCVEKEGISRTKSEKIADNINNIVTVCSKCHKTVETSDIETQLSMTGSSDPRLRIEEFNEDYTRDTSEPPVTVEYNRTLSENQWD